MNTEKKVPIPARIYNASQGGHVAGAVDIIDDNKNKTQATINAENDATFAVHQNEINGLSRQNYVSVNAYSALPSPGNVETIYRVSSWDGKANDGAGTIDVTKYSEYAWYNGAYILMDVKSQIGEVFDISAYNSNIKYVDLAEALGTDGANVPEGIRKGGMSIKFIQSSDNKYVQYRLMSDTFNTTVVNWQGVDDKPTAGSDNLVKSGGVANKLAELDERTKKKIMAADMVNGFVVVDNAGNIVLRYDKDGFNAAKVHKEFVNVLEGKGVSTASKSIYENGFYLTDKKGNVVLKYDDNGLDVAKISSHFLSLINLAETLETGFYIIDKNHNIGFGINKKEVITNSLLSYEIIK